MRISKHTSKIHEGMDLNLLYGKDIFIGSISIYLKIYLARTHSRLLTLVPVGLPTESDTNAFLATISNIENKVAQDRDLHYVVRGIVEKVCETFFT